ncbi:MAG: hypothetical protein LZF61_03930 [Nitrosomonas sp.]|nr:MAG: hypothetical protein LZF61_03930 [Nitrosomonas sp.]
MTDERMPEEMIFWMNQKGWGSHHEQWHFERRWDFWHAIASQPQHPSWVDDLIDDARAKGWSRASTQEGAAGNGEDFLFMHRAMFQLLADNFPQHLHFLRGWNTPPQDPNDPDDSLPSSQSGVPGNTFDINMASAITKIEARNPSFSTDDEFGLFLETNLRPAPEDPLARSPDPGAGLHNYLHNRWSDDQSPINLGDPTVNIFNQRFWKLHGWIDYFWWRFRKHKGLDNSSAYQTKITFYMNMMNQDVHHHDFAHVMRVTGIKSTHNIFAFDFP